MSVKKLLNAALVFGLLALPSSAFAEYSVSTLDSANARDLIAKGEDLATNLKVNVCLAVVGPSGILISFERMDKAPLGCVEAAIAKARAAALFRIKTAVNMQRVNGSDPALSSLPNGMPIGGGVPILNGEQVVGAVGVSGATGDIEVRIAEKMSVGYGLPK